MTNDDPDEATGPDAHDPDEGPGAGLEMQQRGSMTTLTVRFELDAFTAPHFDAACREIFDRGQRTLAVDLRQTTFIDSSGLRALLANHRRFSEGGGELAICGASDVVSRLLSITGLSEHLGLTSPPEG